MAKTYNGTLSLEWYNKQKSILLQETKKETDIPAPKINWVNKDEALFYEIVDTEGRGLEPFWVDRNDIRVKEARPLVLKGVYNSIIKNEKGKIPGTSNVFEIVESQIEDPNIESLFIRGDNLLAVNSLKKILLNNPDFQKIRCAYFDVPYNTKQAFKHYDDNLKHSEWLTFMRDRISNIRDLLREDGCLIVQIDDIEQHYLKVMLDEIFGRDNFVNQICYERSGSAGIGQSGAFVNTAEYILIYSKNHELFEFNELKRSEPLEYETMKRYNKVLLNEGRKELLEEFTSKSNNLPIKIYKHTNFKITSISLRDFENRINEIFSDYKLYFKQIFRTTNPQAENEFQNDLISRMSDGLHSVEYTPSRGKYKNKLTTIYYNNNEIFAWLKDSAYIEKEEIIKSNKMNTIWLHSDIPKADLANEGGVELKRSKKPEQLMKRVFDFATNKGDFVLDIFSGSGTSLAVAHKMGRKWIGVEIGKHADTHILPRLKSVINGTDQIGISKVENWKGGGAFKYYYLGESIITQDEKGIGHFNWSLGKKFIEESFLTSYDYKLINDTSILDPELFREKENYPSVGIQKIGSKSIVSIVSLNEPNGKLGMITYEEIMNLYNKIMKIYSPEYINIFTNRGIDIAYDSKPEDLEVIKIPNAIFSELE